jgi:hypothetical protein
MQKLISGLTKLTLLTSLTFFLTFENLTSINKQIEFEFPKFPVSYLYLGKTSAMRRLSVSMELRHR